MQGARRDQRSMRPPPPAPPARDRGAHSQSPRPAVSRGVSRGRVACSLAAARRKSGSARAAVHGATLGAVYDDERMWFVAVGAFLLGMYFLWADRLGVDYQRRARQIEKTPTTPIAQAKA